MRVGKPDQKAMLIALRPNSIVIGKRGILCSRTTFATDMRAGRCFSLFSLLNIRYKIVRIPTTKTPMIIIFSKTKGVP